MEDNNTVFEKGRNNWENVFENIERKDIKYDDWLEMFNGEIEKCKTPIIDLRCGSGNDTLYIINKGKMVIPCDYSKNVVRNIKKNFPEINRVENFDMRERLPFEDNYTELVITDLSLHYFSEKVTFNILEEIKRVLKPNGLLLFRVNSTKDTNYKPDDRIKIEHNFYETSVGYKRFFDEEDINKFFQEWDKLYINEETMRRYGHEKILWKGAVKVNK